MRPLNRQRQHAGQRHVRLGEDDVTSRQVHRIGAERPASQRIGRTLSLTGGGQIRLAPASPSRPHAALTCRRPRLELAGIAGSGDLRDRIARGAVLVFEFPRHLRQYADAVLLGAGDGARQGLEQVTGEVVQCLLHRRDHRPPSAFAGILEVTTGGLGVGGIPGPLRFRGVPADRLGGVAQDLVRDLERRALGDYGQGVTEQAAEDAADMVADRLDRRPRQLPDQHAFQDVERGLHQLPGGDELGRQRDLVKTARDHRPDLGRDQLGGERDHCRDHGFLLHYHGVRRDIQRLGEVIQGAVQADDQLVVVFPSRGERAGKRRLRRIGQLADRRLRLRRVIRDLVGERTDASSPRPELVLIDSGPR